MKVPFGSFFIIIAGGNWNKETKLNGNGIIEIWIRLRAYVSINHSQYFAAHKFFRIGKESFGHEIRFHKSQISYWQQMVQ